MEQQSGSPRASVATHASPSARLAEDDLFAVIHRSTLSAQACHQIRDRIMNGRLAPGTKVAEASLAAQLGVSRTPLHEAMLMLAHEGLVEPLGRKGWLVAPLTQSTASELYPVLARVECLAVEFSGPLSVVLLEGLNGDLERLDGSGLTAEARLVREREWHARILDPCSNRTVVELAKSLIDRVFRYEMAFTRNGMPPLPTKLDAVLAALNKGSVAGAARMIEVHWRERADLVIPSIPSLAPGPRS